MQICCTIKYIMSVCMHGHEISWHVTINTVFCGENQVRERGSALGSLLKTPTKDRDVVESKRSIRKSVRLLSTKTGWTCGTTSTCLFISQSWNLQMLWNDFRPCFGYQKSEHRLPKGCRCQYSRRLSKTIRA